MALEKLGSAIYESLKKILRSSVVDEMAVKELVRDLQRSLLQADVNVRLVLELSKRVEERALKEKIPPGIPRKEHVIKVVYEELARFLGEKPIPLSVKPGNRNVFMLVGIQGSGKTTTAAKLAKYFQKRGFRTALICADTFRPGAFAQLKQLADQINVPIYGDEGEKDAVKIAIDGLRKFEDYEVVIVDTAGRHKDEHSLIEEMRMLEKAIKPDEIIMVIDGTIGQLASAQAEAFNKATTIGSIIVAKLDGSAKGGGALSAVASTGAPIKFIGVGEKIDALEPFDPPRFVGRLLGMGDLQSLIEKVREAEVKIPEKKAKDFLSGKFTLSDMYEQFEAVKKMGPLDRIFRMIPGLGYEIPQDKLDVAEEQLGKWRVIIQSMTPEERENPKIVNSSRIRRIARGSGTTEKDVKSLIQQYFMLRKMMKSLKRKRLPFFGRKIGL
ncbi:MAG: signal recognition particle protein Srp54 [Nitrososphaerota archaeon]|nr:signal recognition particle protein Srp54 [Candidatus Bathyarchaeota archaeon]MDW8048517.1 signal recognition particle protein Srp54 [Nitrososphaerota archaeon]